MTPTELLPVAGSDEQKRTNEIGMAIPLLEGRDIAGKDITGDALLTRRNRGHPTNSTSIGVPESLLRLTRGFGTVTVNSAARVLVAVHWREGQMYGPVTLVRKVI